MSLQNEHDNDALFDAINLLEDVQSYTRDLLHTLNTNGESYLNGQFQSDLEHLRSILTTK